MEGVRSAHGLPPSSRGRVTVGLRPKFETEKLLVGGIFKVGGAVLPGGLEDPHKLLPV